MLHRTGDPGLPVFKVRSVTLHTAVGEREFQYGTESALFPDHSVMAGRGDDFVRPPAGRHLGGIRVFPSRLGDNGICKIIGKGSFGLGIVREARLQDFPTDRPTVDVQLVHAQSGGHPSGRNHLLLVFHGRDEPTGAVGGAVVVRIADRSGHDWGIRRGNPDGLIPGGVIQSVGTDADFRRKGGSTSHCGSGREGGDKELDQFFRHDMKCYTDYSGCRR